jgi:amino acid transporter
MTPQRIAELVEPFTGSGGVNAHALGCLGSGGHYGLLPGPSRSIKVWLWYTFTLSSAFVGARNWSVLPSVVSQLEEIRAPGSSLRLVELAPDGQLDLEMPPRRVHGPSAYQKISDGCDQRCAFCAIPFMKGNHRSKPIDLILREIGQPWAARVLGASAVIALPTVILAFFYGQSRIFFTVARDGLLPRSLARVSSRGTPVRITLFTAVVTSVFAGLIPLTSIAALANAGTLAAFIAVCSAMLVLRRREPDTERRFRTPAAGFVGTFGILGCLYLFISLPNRTQLFFLAAQVIGLILYAIYGSRAADRARADANG